MPSVSFVAHKLANDPVWHEAFHKEVDELLDQGLTRGQAFQKVFRLWEQVAYKGEVPDVKYPQEEEFYRLLMEEPPLGTQAHTLDCRQPDCTDCWEPDRFNQYSTYHSNGQPRYIPAKAVYERWLAVRGEINKYVIPDTGKPRRFKQWSVWGEQFVTVGHNRTGGKRGRKGR